MTPYIENGHVSRRSANAGPSHAALEAMRDGRKDIPDSVYNYLTKTHDGRILRSSTVYIKDEKDKVTGIFAINYDMTELTDDAVRHKRHSAKQPGRGTGSAYPPVGDRAAGTISSSSRYSS